MSEDEAIETFQESATGIMDESRPRNDFYEIMLDGWVEVLANRAQACGSDRGYPFILTEEGIEFRDVNSPAYEFQLLVSLGSDDTHQDGTTVFKLFEELSAEVAGKYLGGSKTSVVFGSPRHNLPTGFRDAVMALVRLLREGEGCKDREGLSQSKDDHLDIVTWH